MDWSLLLSAVAILLSAVSLFIIYFQNKKLEDYRHQLKLRQKSAIISDFFALWGKYRGKEGDIFEDDNQALYDYFENLNKMSYQIAVSIENPVLIDKTMKHFLDKDSSGTDIPELLNQYRRELHGNDAESFNNLAIWPNEELQKRLFGIYDKK